MIVNKAWEDISGRPNMIKTSDSEYYIELGVKVERLNNGKVIIQDTTPFGEYFKPITSAQQDVFNSFGFRAGQLSVLIKSMRSRLASLERIESDPKVINDLKKNIFDLNVEFEEIIHNFAIPKSETGIFSQKNNL